jgi:hypothetical protein
MRTNHAKTNLFRSGAFAWRNVELGTERSPPLLAAIRLLSGTVQTDSSLAQKQQSVAYTDYVVPVITHQADPRSSPSAKDIFRSRIVEAKRAGT